VVVGLLLLFINRHKNDGMQGRKFTKTYKKSKKKG